MKRIVSKIFVQTMLMLLSSNAATAATGKWNSQTTGTSISYTASQATGTAAKDQSGKPMTVVYLENLGFQKTGQVSNADNVAWLRQQGWQVIELDYGHSDKAVSPVLNKDIIAINSSLQSGKFCGQTCSSWRSYILMEGYRISRDISYYHDDPTVYNYPDVYNTSEGDSLYLDLVYPASPSSPVPVLVTFSYSNSFATVNNGKLTDANKHKRMYLPYYWGATSKAVIKMLWMLAGLMTGTVYRRWRIVSQRRSISTSGHCSRLNLHSKTVRPLCRDAPD